jgi:hypothetical protein
VIDAKHTFFAGLLHKACHLRVKFGGARVKGFH